MPRHHTPLPPTLSGPFAYAEARVMGVSPRRLRASDLERPFHATRIRPEAAPRSAFEGPQAIDGRARARVIDRARAYSRVMSRHGFFTGMTAAALLGCPLPNGFDADADLSVGIMHPHRAARARGVAGLQTREHLAYVMDVEGLRVTTPASTWAMLGGELSERWLVIMGDHFVRVPRDHRGRAMPNARLATPAQLEAAALAPGRRHRKTLLRALTLVRVGSASRLETEYRLDAEAARLPDMELDVELRDAGGALIAIVDGMHRAFGVIVEVEGDHHRTDRAQWNRDIDRTAALAAQGWEVVRLTSRRIRDGSATSVVASALRRHGWVGPRDR
ncbi:MAG: hypothetical protein BGO47_02765 [Microbacterium sp. 67-17]|uniref:DUF559 domain-containing protein n=1 Tax=Microbacterium sp. 67-17 TaxID=1895782 RepID=UPI00095B1A4E|nr:DUF559 domain-containing protein [Microbacterium sp. 67-17]OJV95422.1 MAG: hypothetical protein BGO47_02765 [Microbacterium sp. 67-17]